MTRTLPSLREQARHALLLLGVPTPARLVVDVHAAFFDGDLSVPALAGLLRDEERASAEAALICPGLNADLTPARGMVALCAWPLDDRLGTPAVTRARLLAATVRVAEFAAARPGASAATHDLLGRLAAEVPGHPARPAHPTASGTAAELAATARAALDDPTLAAAVAAEEPARAAALTRAAPLDERQRLFGLPSVPHQRDGS